MSQITRSNSSAFEPFQRTSSKIDVQDQQHGITETINARKDRKKAFNNLRELFKCSGTTARRVLPCLKSQFEENGTKGNVAV
jgi:hypothetical protein